MGDNTLDSFIKRLDKRTGGLDTFAEKLDDRIYYKEQDPDSLDTVIDKANDGDLGGFIDRLEKRDFQDSTPDPVLLNNAYDLLNQTIIKGQKDIEKTLREVSKKDEPYLKFLKPLSIIAKWFDVITRPSNAWFGGVWGAEWNNKLMKRLEEHGFKPKKTEVWVLQRHLSDPLRGKFVFRVTDKKAKESRIVTLNPQDLGYTDKRDVVRDILESVAEGMSKGIKKEENYFGRVVHGHAFYEPERTAFQKAIDAVTDFAINLYGDPMTYLTTYTTPKLTNLVKATHKALEAKSPVYKVIVANIEYSKPVTTIRKALGWWRGIAKHAKERARQMRGAVKGEFVQKYDPVIREIKEMHRPLIKSYAAHKGIPAKEAQKKLYEGMLIVSRKVEDAVKNGTKTNVDDLAKELITKQFPDMPDVDKKAVHDLMKKVSDFYNKTFASTKEYASGIKGLVSKEAKPYYIPLRHLTKEGVRGAEVTQKVAKRATSATKRILDQTDELLEYLKNNAPLIDDDLPKVVASDIYEHLQRAYRRSYYIDLDNFLSKYFPKVGEIHAHDLKKLVSSDIDAAADTLVRWKANGAKKQLINKIEGLGFKLSGKGAKQNAKAFLKKYDLFQFPPDLYKGKTPPSFIADRQVSELFRSYSKGIFNNDELNAFSYAMTKLTAPFKAMATTFNPFFHPKYVATDVVQVIKGGVDPIDLATYHLPRSTAIKIGESIRVKRPELIAGKKIKINGIDYDLTDIIDLMERMGVWHRARSLMSTSTKSFINQYLKELDKPTTLKVISKPVTSFKDTISNIDDIFRTSLFLDRLEKNIKNGMKMLSPTELKQFIHGAETGSKAAFEAMKKADALYDASMWVTKHMYSYDVSPFVKKYIRPFIPFVAWKLENGPEMAKAMAQLDFVLKMAKAREQLHSYFPLSEETKKYGKKSVNKDYVYEVHIPTDQPGKDLRFYFTLPAMWRSLEDIKAMSDAMSGLMSQTGPLGTIIGFIQKKAYYPDEYSTKGRYVPAPIWAAFMSKTGVQKAIPDLFRVAYDARDGNLYLYMRQDILNLINGLVPTLRTITKSVNKPVVKLDVDYEQLSNYLEPMPTVKELGRTGEKLVGKELQPNIAKVPKEASKYQESLYERQLIHEYKRLLPVLQFDYDDLLREQQNRIRDLEELIQKYGGRKMYGGQVYLLPTDPEGLINSINDIYNKLLPY